MKGSLSRVLYWAGRYIKEGWGCDCWRRWRGRVRNVGRVWEKRCEARGTGSVVPAVDVPDCLRVLSADGKEGMEGTRA